MNSKTPDIDSPLFKIIDIAEASVIWGVSQPYIKLFCSKEEVICRKVGRTLAT
ncbi:hypothetical protein [Lysinibacillus sp. NPDC093692]|uniref:hypothetical protein n=1 Tax=Lysinibacillus sp. NPDC093692 TaxID=3390578 RepID=UPI003D06EAA1